MDLVIDVGNNFTKSAVFLNEEIIFQCRDRKGDYSEILNFNQFSELKRVIISTVRPLSNEFESLLNQFDKVVRLSHETPLPVELNYNTPNTLGRDRIAGVVGAFVLFPNQNSLVIDAGTCITYDLIDENNIYQGGSISPGLDMRYKALHDFTGALPYVEHDKPEMLVGKSTVDSIRTGVYNGLVNEINGTIRKYKLEKSPINIVICGGNAKDLLKGMDEKAIHEENIVLKGLHKILIYNALHKK